VVVASCGATDSTRVGFKQAADEQQVLAELSALYAEVDAMYVGWSCPSSSECCRFGITGKQPFVTSIEMTALEGAVARRGGLPSKKKRALPLTDNPEKERVCPLLSREGKCSVYADRPLGCRTFYCNRAQRGDGPGRDQLRQIVQRLTDLAARHRFGGEVSRPLDHVLRGWPSS